MKIKFREIHLSKKNKDRLHIVNSIIEEYRMDGYTLTLRQLYYQLVSRDVVPNKQSEYSKLSTLLKEGRMSGIVDWNAIEDRLRIPSSPSSFNSPKDVMDAVIQQYQLPRQEGQNCYVEVWVEKDALSGVLKRVTKYYHVPIMVNRGYSSVSAMYDAYKRFSLANDNGQSIRILYLGDYDPSGIDMIRDIKSRTEEFIGTKTFDFDIIPIALTIQQIRQYNPPPNPAKLTDPRAKEFLKNHGNTSWEVDALKPQILNKLLTDNIEKLIDVDRFNEFINREQVDKDRLIELRDIL